MEDSSKDKLITFDVEFFTSKEPYATPEFCGCVLSTVQGEETMASKDLVKDCYVKAIKGGPAPRTGRTVRKRPKKHTQRRKFLRDNRRRMKKRTNKIMSGQRNRKSLRKMIKSMKQQEKHFNGRSKRDIPDENFDNELFPEEDYLEDEDFLDEEDLPNDQDYEESSFYKMRNEEDDYDDYDDYDYNMSSDWI